MGGQEPIGSGGVAVLRNDVVEDVAAAVEQERLEGWIMREVEQGAALPGLDPPNEQGQARYAAARRRGER